MKRFARGSLVLACAIAVHMVGCGGGETAVIGFANHGNTLGVGGIADSLGEALAESPGTPEVTDHMIGEIFSALLDKARQGDAEAALVVLTVAEEQREAEEE